MIELLLDLTMGSAAGYGLHQYRNFWLHRPLRFHDATPFDGTLYQVGHSEILKREGAAGTNTTLVCFPGFLESQHYFTELYADTDAEFIALNNADYFSGFYTKQTIMPDWGKQNPHPVSTIAHDAFLLCEAIENLASHDNIIVHGHSRGGAVVLEAARQRPALMEGVTALLEAAVLPQAKAAPQLERFVRYGGLYVFPMYMGLLRKLPAKWTITEKSHYPLTPRKREVLANTSRLPKRYSTAIGNMRNIRDWQQQTGYDVYNHFRDLRFLIPERDSVLCRDTMFQSASQAQHARIIETRNTDHFISLEQPATTLAALGF